MEEIIAHLVIGLLRGLCACVEFLLETGLWQLPLDLLWLSDANPPPKRRRRR